jgi:micrococcal nuclease
VVPQVRTEEQGAGRGGSSGPEGQRGLWADPNPVPPWDWRQNERERRQKARSDVDTGYWLNTSNGVRHNRSCPNYRNTKRGRPCGPDEGRACGMCGG